MTYITEGALIMIPALVIVGKLLKSIPGIPNWIIPLALLPPGILGAMALGGWTVDSAVQGVLVTGAAVWGNQVMKQIAGRKEDKNADSDN